MEWPAAQYVTAGPPPHKHDTRPGIGRDLARSTALASITTRAEARPASRRELAGPRRHKRDTGPRTGHERDQIDAGLRASGPGAVSHAGTCTSPTKRRPPRSWIRPQPSLGEQAIVRSVQQRQGARPRLDLVQMGTPAQVRHRPAQRPYG